jgi:hypothetical protein
MDAVSRGFLFFSQRRLGLVTIPGIFLPGDVTVEQRLVPEFVSAKPHDYCYEIEMKTVLERAKNRQARAIAVILRACDWGKCPVCEVGSIAY